MPRKLQQPQIKLSKTQEIILWMKSKPIYTTILMLFFIAIILLAIAFTKSLPKEPVIETPTKNVTETQFNALIEQLEKQNSKIEKLQAQNNNLENNLKLVEKRLQANTDVLKRFCEYIVVITVDKKIIPRQCLSDYKWLKEEGQ